MEQNNEGCAECGKEQVINENTSNVVQQNVPCTGCRKNNFSGKLGTCKECIVANTIGAILGWLISLALLYFYPDKKIFYAPSGIASFFTLLLFAHGIAYLIKKNKTKK